MEPPMRKPKQRKPNDLSRSLTTLDVHHTLIAVVEMSLSSWLVAGLVPGAAEPGAREPGRRAKPPRQSHEGDAGPIGHSRLQSETEACGGGSRNAAHARRRAVSAQHSGRAQTRYGASPFHLRSDPQHRA